MNSKERKRLDWHASMVAQVHRHWCQDAKDEWEERAAIMQHEGDMDKIGAEMRAVMATRESRLMRGLEIADEQD